MPAWRNARLRPCKRLQNLLPQPQARSRGLRHGVFRAPTFLSVIDHGSMAEDTGQNGRWISYSSQHAHRPDLSHRQPHHAGPALFAKRWLYAGVQYQGRHGRQRRRSGLDQTWPAGRKLHGTVLKRGRPKAVPKSGLAGRRRGRGDLSRCSPDVKKSTSPTSHKSIEPC